MKVCKNAGNRHRKRPLPLSIDDRSERTSELADTVRLAGMCPCGDTGGL